MQPNLRTGWQALKSLRLLGKLLGEVALRVEPKDDLRQHDGRVLTASVCRLQAVAQTLTVPRRGN